MKQKTSKFKRIAIATMAAVCALSSAAIINANAVSGSPEIVYSSETTNGYSLSLSSVSGSAVGSKWAVTNGGPTSLKSKNSIQYVKSDGTTGIYNGNNSYVSVESTYQLRTVSTSSLSSYSRLFKVEAAGYASCISTDYYPDRTIYMNAYY